MGRHHRRGYVGQTNLPSPHKHEPNGHNCGPPVLYTHKDPIPSASPTHNGSSRKRQLRAKWKLDLAPIPRGLESLHGPDKPHDNHSAETRLGANIATIQHDRKSFKDEPWYRSPIGAGSKSSVILAALKGQDYKDTGYLPRDTIVRTLQHSHFGLTEHEVLTLLHRYEPTQDDVHYKSFVEHLHFTEKPSPQHDAQDIIFRHQRYLEKIHDHANRLLELSANVNGLSPSPVKLSPLASSKHMVTNNEPNMVLGNSPPHRLLPLVEESSSPKIGDYAQNRFSFEFDKHRRALRAQAKATTLLAHISRVEEYARHQDIMTAQQDTLRIATKAFHHGEHLARVFDEQHRQLDRTEKQGKGLVRSPQKTALTSVSKDSMFYVDPTG